MSPLFFFTSLNLLLISQKREIVLHDPIALILLQLEGDKDCFSRQVQYQQKKQELKFRKGADTNISTGRELAPYRAVMVSSEIDDRLRAGQYV